MGQQRRQSEHSLHGEERTGASNNGGGDNGSELSSPLTPASESSEQIGLRSMIVDQLIYRNSLGNIPLIGNTSNGYGNNSSQLHTAVLQPEIKSVQPYSGTTSTGIAGNGNPFIQNPTSIVNPTIGHPHLRTIDGNVNPLIQASLTSNIPLQPGNYSQYHNATVNAQFPQTPLHYSAAHFPVLPQATPVLTVQDRPMVPPVYNGVNPHYPGVRLINNTPPIFAVDNFISPQECDFLINAAEGSFTPAPVVGPGAGEVSSSRTSSTCYLAREDLPAYMEKISVLTGKPVAHCELPQVGRYLPTQQYLQHFDAFDLSNENGVRFASNGGQRTVTVLVYLNDVESGGQTSFPSLNINVQPKRGMALVFFPASVDGLLDKMALHAALPAIDVKYVSQVWIRQSNYEGQPSKRLNRIMDHSISNGLKHH